MSIWKETTTARPTPLAPEVKEPARYEALSSPEPVHSANAPLVHAGTGTSGKESLIASDITIEGKIEGGGSVRIAGKFKGDVMVEGDLTIETGAKLTGSVRAAKVTIAGELEGNVEQASRVDLLQTGIVTGNLKAGSLAVAPGARMRGQAEFGWEDETGTKTGWQSNGHGVGGGTTP